MYLCACMKEGSTIRGLRAGSCKVGAKSCELEADSWELGTGSCAMGAKSWGLRAGGWEP